MSPASRSLLVLCFALGAASAAAQPATSQCELDNLKPLLPLSAAAQEKVIAAIRQANTCLKTKDATCAAAAVASVRELSLSDTDRALLAIPRADIATQRNDGDAALAIYREAIALPASGEFAWRQISWRLAALLNARGEFAETLRLFGSAECERWTAEAWALRALAYQGLGARALALESFQASMKLYELEGRPMPATFQELHEALVAAEAPAQSEGDDLVPLVHSPPGYPERALKNGDEGWVQLEFDITDLGAVENVRALASNDKVFEPNAIAALKRWRYVPTFENGLPVRANGKRTTIVFCLDVCSSSTEIPPLPDSP
jgi:TonB family protein